MSRACVPKLVVLSEDRGSKARLASRIEHTVSAVEPQLTKVFAKTGSFPT